MVSNEEIYQQFPRKREKIAAFKAIDKAVKALSRTMGEQLARDTLFAATAAYAASPVGSRADREHIPYPASWFNAGGYLDDPGEWQHGGKNGKKPTLADLNRIFDESDGVGDRLPS